MTIRPGSSFIVQKLSSCALYSHSSVTVVKSCNAYFHPPTFSADSWDKLNSIRLII